MWEIFKCFLIVCQNYIQNLKLVDHKLLNKWSLKNTHAQMRISSLLGKFIQTKASFFMWSYTKNIQVTMPTAQRLIFS